MLTPLGTMFLIATIYCGVRSSDKLFSLLIFSSLFQAGSIINIGTLGIQPYYFVACCFILRTFLDRSFGGVSPTVFRGKLPLLLFCVIGVGSAFTLPLIFRGVPVYDPKVGVDFFRQSPLQFGLGNVAQAAYLGVQGCVVLSASKLKADPAKFLTSYWASFYFLLTIILIQFICQRVGVAFPSSFFANNPSYYITNIDLQNWDSRVMGTFSEPSLAGAVLAMFTGGLLARVLNRERKFASLLFVFLALAMVRSSSAVAAVIIVAFLLMLNSKLYEFPWYIKKTTFKQISILALVGLGSLAAIIVSPLRQSLLVQTVDKSDSLSFVFRTTADLYSLLLAIQTYGLGVGLGSNRPSSLFAAITSNTGVIGICLFAILAFQLTRNAARTTYWVGWASLALFIDLVLSGPDITFPPMWVLLALMARIGAANSVISRSIAQIPDGRKINQLMG